MALAKQLEDNARAAEQKAAEQATIAAAARSEVRSWAVSALVTCLAYPVLAGGAANQAGRRSAAMN